ncbi:hypothetical protein SAMN05443549_107123 [Flavobacterium fluvii]|uniref:Uncharacterized protein n=1 Tax=Flavobacterium fluvii TaxID=468056 RepID=A0A1M5N767_9FLAO|nr:hypothetical protein SAMN05443549_107123 [Flavobacterium fluvii]
MFFFNTRTIPKVFIILESSIFSNYWVSNTIMSSPDTKQKGSTQC